MNDRDQHFRRIDSRLNRPVLEARRVGIAGCGQMGSQVSWLLAQHGVRYLALFDGDRLEPENLVRHLLPAGYLWTNKAEATASWLRLNIPGVEAVGIPRNLDESMSDLEIDSVLQHIDVLVVATDNLVVQRRLARRARAMGIIAVVPGLYPDGGGEVFVELGFDRGCTECWYDFRPTDARLRDAAVTPAQDRSVVAFAIYLTLGVLDPGSPWAEELAPEPGSDRPPQLFLVRDGANVRRAVVTPRPGCAGCRIGPSPLNPGPGRPRGRGSRPWVATGLQAAPRPATAGWSFTLDQWGGTPRIDMLDVSQRAVVAGFPVVVSWQTSNSTRVELDGVAYPPTGSIQLSVENSRTFRLRAINPTAQVTADTAWVQAITPPRVRTLTFAALPGVPPVRFASRAPAVSRAPRAGGVIVRSPRPGSPTFPRSVRLAALPKSSGARRWSSR